MMSKRSIIYPVLQIFLHLEAFEVIQVQMLSFFRVFMAFDEDNAPMSSIQYFENHVYFV